MQRIRWSFRARWRCPRAWQKCACRTNFIFLLPQWWPANNLIFLQKNVAAKMDLLWKFLKPISFALIGKEVNFGKLDGTVVAYGFVIILLGSVVSLAVAYFFCFHMAMMNTKIIQWTQFIIQQWIFVISFWNISMNVHSEILFTLKISCANGTLPRLFLNLLILYPLLDYIM